MDLNMNETHPISCRCGAFQAEVARPDLGTRAVCYCRDCQEFSRFLGSPKGMLDEFGGTDIVAVRPRFVTMIRGQDQLTCMSLSERGTLRWFTACCKTPFANTPRDIKQSHFGLVHTCLELGEKSLDDSFGPVVMRINRQSASGTPGSNSPVIFVYAAAKYVASMAWSRVSGAYRVNPLFKGESGSPLASPYVVSPEERRVLRGGA